ncbi:enoyl-CoA hydratase-related protein [Fundicoccus culcitae]|uniref:Enoyl-CoA hydratase-related protein n=1 Tax=Fundicoccus culcitae TaxID=2969821 RepID=A0ABY5P4L3_9LACT|nr:enoyl-CoA hydratase-related protein [Fundicoccus culcitae]UUX33425.1 enoyl-CoA hydratase-related protein [Fundicoccus culcitae]
MTEFNKIQFEVRNNLGYLTINQPKKLNALDTETLLEMDQVLTDIDGRDDVRVLIVTGAGEKAFVAGANVAEMKDKNPMEAFEFSTLGNSVFSKIAGLKQPTIAAVNGFALGGGSELALACDIRIASDNARFGQPEVGLGIVPGFGGTQRLSRLVGVAKAKELIFTARNIKAEEAEKIGLVNKVVPLEGLLEEVEKLGTQIASNGRFAVEQSKVLIDQGIDLPLDHSLILEANGFGLCFATEDQTEGMSAFLEKRDANFTGK